MIAALGVAIIVIAAVVALVSPSSGMLIYWAWVIVRPQEVWPEFGGGLPSERIVAVALLAGLLMHGKLRNWGEMDRGRAALALLVFLGINYMSVATAVDKGYALVAVNEFAKTIIFFVCIIALLEEERQLRRGLWVYAGAIAWAAGYPLWNYVAHPYFRQGIQRAMGAQWGTASDPNSVAGTLVLSLPILVVLFKTATGRKRLLLTAIIAVALVCTVLTGSRMGFIMLLLVVTVTAWRSTESMLKVPALLLFLVIGWLAMPTEYQERYNTIIPFLSNPFNKGKNAEEASAHGRVVGFTVAWQMFTDRPILGVGANNFALAWRRPDTPYNYHGEKSWNQPHNLPGQIIAELGLLGLIGFIAYLVAVWRELRDAKLALETAANPPPLLTALVPAISLQLVTLFVAGFSGHNLHRVDWYVAGALAVVVCRLATLPVAVETETGIDLAALPSMSRSQPG